MRTVAVFDFDGTLTTKDSLLEFILFAKGKVKGYIEMLLFSPMIMLMFLRLLDHSKCKELLLRWIFRGWKRGKVQYTGKAFKNRGLKMLREDTVSLLKQHLEKGDEVYVISASLDEWVRPICLELGVKPCNILCTSMNFYIGNFNTPNCYGSEKMERLKQREPDRSSYRLIAYGDSKGDKQMFAYADEWHLVK